MCSVEIRSARSEDFDFAFERMLEAGRGLIEKYFGAGKQARSRKVVEALWRGKPNRFHHSNGLIALEGDQPRGLLIAYPVGDSSRDGLRTGRILLEGGLPLFWYYLSHPAELARALSFPEGKDGEYYIGTIALAPEARGKGMGSQLLWAGLERARILGIRFVSLVVAKDNQGAKSLYQRLGFRVDESPDVQHDLVDRMVLDLETTPVPVTHTHGQEKE